MSEKPSSNAPRRSFQAPKGTRDFYPQDMLRRRYITDAWRRVSLRHGFEEIDGPTFEHLGLYTVKSGEGIVSELFSFQRAGGDDTYALRPEFTPTLARMYAARAKQLPQPTKWFCIPNFFRAERPQRGRLREFFQWNVDVIGHPDRGVLDSRYDLDAEADVEVVGAALGCLELLGLVRRDCRVDFNNRMSLDAWLMELVHIREDQLSEAHQVLDRSAKLNSDAIRLLAQSKGFDEKQQEFFATASVPDFDEANPNPKGKMGEAAFVGHQALEYFKGEIARSGFREWIRFNPHIVRGLAYYTGMVFEVIAEGERAVAGGGRYDNLIELFGGPPTPACGFGMGDVVLGNLLEDRGLIPEGRDLLEALSRPMPIRPDAFVISSGKDGTDEQVTPLVAKLRRGVESQRYSDSQTSDDAAKRMKPWDAGRYEVPPLHARRSYKATKNVGKLLGEANNAHARFAVIIESAETCSLKNLESGEQTPDIPLTEVAARIARA